MSFLRTGRRQLLSYIIIQLPQPHIVFSSVWQFYCLSKNVKYMCFARLYALKSRHPGSGKAV